jgi:hypothetical protein
MLSGGKRLAGKLLATGGSPELLLSGIDRRAVIAIRDAYLRGVCEVDFPGLREHLAIDSHELAVALKRLASLGVVEKRVNEGTDVKSNRWIIMPAVAELAATIETPPDRVADFANALKQNRWTFWVVLVFVGLTASVSLVNGILELIDRFRR